MAMSRRRAVVLVSTLIILVMGIAAGALLVAATQTDYGRQRLRDLIMRQLQPRMAGTIYLGRISGGLFGGVTLDSLLITDADGRVFVAAGQVSVTYDVRDLLDRRVLLAHLEVERPVVHILQHENGEWNFRQLTRPRRSRPATPSTGRGFTDFIRIDSATVHDGSFLLTLPWHPADSLTGARRDSSIRVNLAREDATIRRVGDNFARTWEWSSIQLASPGVRIAHPDSAGQRYDIASLSVVEADPPITMTDARGMVRVQGDSVWIDLPHFDFLASTGSAVGKIVWGSDLPVRYDIRITGDSVSLSDVAWVYPTLPTAGGGNTLLRIHNDPDDLHVLNYALSEMDVRTTGSRLRGAMTFGVGGPVLRVTELDLRADPVDMDLLRTLAGGPFPYDWQGQISGTARGRGGPLDRFWVDSTALTYRDARVPGATSSGSGKGELNILDPAFTSFRGFRLRLDHLDLRTPQSVNPEFARLGGSVSGSAILDSVWTDVRLREADLLHQDGTGQPSRFTGGGRVTLEPEFIRYDLTMEARPLDFSTLALSYPGLPLRGSYSGPLRVRGTLADLTLAGSLLGPAGEISVDGHFDLFGPGYSAVGQAAVSGLDLAVLLDRLDVPSSSLTAATRYALQGDSLATLSGTLAVDVERGTLDSVRVYPSHAALHFAGGRAVLDTLELETAALTVSASGGLGLVAEQPDSVIFTVHVDSLGGFRRYIASNPEDGAEPDTLLGGFTVSGLLAGSAEGVAVRGTVRGSDLRTPGLRAASLGGAFNITDIFGVPRGSATVSIDTAVAAGVRLTDATVSTDLLGGGSAEARLTLNSASGPRAAAGVAILRRGDTTRVQLDSATILVGDNRWSLVRPALLTSTLGGIALDTLRLRGLGGGEMLLAGILPVADSLRFHFHVDSVPLLDLGLLAQTSTTLDGRATLDVDLAGTRAAPTITMQGLVRGAQFGDVRLARLSLTGGYEQHRLSTALALARGDSVLLRAQGSLPVDLALLPRRRRLLDESLRGNIHSEQVDLSVVEAFTTAVRDASGSFSVNLDLGGTVRQPSVTGGVQVADGSLTLTALGDVKIRGVNTDIALLGDSLAVRRMEASSDARGSLLRLEGGIGFGDYENPTFDLTLTARNFHAIARPRVADLDVSTSPTLRLSGPLSGALLTGGVRVERGTVYLPEFTSKQVIDLEDLGEFNVVDTTVFANRTLLPAAPPELVRNLTLRDVGIQMGDDVWLRGPEANINLGGRVSLTTARDARTPDSASLALEGLLTANRGTYRLNLGLVQRTFTIERGSLRFFGEPDLNPALDIVAVYTVRQFDRQAARQDVQVRAMIGGTMVNPQLQLTGGFGGEGGLALSESDAVSYLVTGVPAFAVGAEQSSQLTAARVALASLGSYLGDRAAGGVFDVVQFQTSGLGQGDARSLRTASQGILAGTRLGVGKQLSDRVFVSANAGLCQLGAVVGGDRFNALDFAESIGVKVDYRLGGGLALSAGVEPPTSQLYCGRELTTRGFAPTPRQWAIDLFRTWRF